jgi:hypothetical protein
MYINANIIPVENIPGIRGGVKSSMIYLIHCKNLCKCHNVLPPSRAIKEKKNNNNICYISA